MIKVHQGHVYEISDHEGNKEVIATVTAGTPEETFYFDTSGRLILAKVWVTRESGEAPKPELQPVEYLYDGDKVLARLLNGASMPGVTYNYGGLTYTYDGEPPHDADDVRKEAETYYAELTK
jgi:hypothetical protein